MAIIDLGSSEGTIGPRPTYRRAKREKYSLLILVVHGSMTIEHTNSQLRQYLPKVTELSRWFEEENQAVKLILFNKPRKSLGWKTPAEATNDFYKSEAETGVATTG
jgi:3-deoxy-D-arabino-heptulosonate 7-phosphate (DAHP) synthase